MKHGTPIFIMLIASSVVALGDNDSWKVPLEKKAEIFEKNVLERHWIDGLYPSSIEIPPDGGPVDQTTAGSSNVAHSVNWTANYLGGQCYRYLFTKDEAVQKHADQVFEAIYRCQLVTGVRGLQSRGYIFGHGPSYEEREGSSHANDWHQGVGEYSNLRWRGDPSHHGYSDGIYALGMYYDLVAQGEQKERCREAIDALVSYWVDNDLLIKKRDPNKTPTPILGFTDGKTPNTRIIMAAAGLKVAYHATGKQKFADAYEKLVEQYGFRTWKSFPQPMRRRSGHDDAEHVFCHLENLFRIETDPELLRFYRLVADALWANHKDDHQSLFTYIYLSLTPDSPDRDQALADALNTLQSYPTNKIFRPRMNSLRKDIELVDGKAAEPLPMYESPWDNEYQWKGNLYQLDGWLGRPIVSLAVPEADAMVMYATDSRGDIYMTIDGGKRWQEISENLPAHAHKLAAGPRIRMLYVAADNGFYKTARAGDTWERLPLPADSGRPQNIVVDRQNPHVLYAVTELGIYRSIDFGEEWIGERWESLTKNCPPANEARFFVGLGAPDQGTQIYALLDGRIYRRSADASEWVRGEALGASGYVDVYPWLAIDPNNPLKIYTGYRSRYGPLSGSYLSISEDGGESFSRSLRKIYEDYRQGGIPAVLRGRFNGGTVSDLAIDPDDGTIYVAVDEGVMQSTDNGVTWKKINHGLDIPRATAIFAPLANDQIYVSTPAGLFALDKRNGKQWKDANLCLIFRRNTKREVGSADYLDAYWRGRYFGFITDEQASADPRDW